MLSETNGCSKWRRRHAAELRRDHWQEKGLALVDKVLRSKRGSWKQRAEFGGRYLESEEYFSKAGYDRPLVNQQMRALIDLSRKMGNVP